MVYVPPEKKPSLLPEFPQRVDAIDIAEHQVWMSFNSDSDAEIWFNWWHEEGYKYYLEYHKNHDSN